MFHSKKQTHELTPTPRVPDDAPAFAVGIEYGRRLPAGTVVDVDYDAARTTLDALGAPTDRSDLTVVVGSQEPNSSTLHGLYDIGTKTAHLVGPSQKYLQHELQHYVDYGEPDDLTLAENVRNKIGEFGVNNIQKVGALSIPAGMLPIVNAWYGAKYGVEPLSRDAAETLYLSSSAISLGAVACFATYALNPYERRARKASRKKLPQVVSHNRQKA